MAEGAAVERRRRRGPVIAWIACAGWAAYWIHDEAGKPPPEPLPAWLLDPLPHEAWELPILVAGALILAAFLAYSATRGLRWRLRPSRRDSEVFAEAAGVWLLLDVAVYVASNRGFGESWGLWTWSAVPLVIVGVGLAWPVLRGVDGRRSQSALGLTRGRGIATETAIGLLAVPAVLAIQALWTNFVRADPGRPHPIDEWLYSGEPELRTYAIVACMFTAPLAEEFGFRGLLQRFFRDAGARLPRFLGIAAAVLATSSLFALAHPYGWLAMPPLVLYGAVAAVLREWRGSLLAPVALHFGVNVFLLVRDSVAGRL